MARKVYRALGGHVFLVLLGIAGLMVGLLSVRAETYPTFSDDATLTMLDEATRTELLERVAGARGSAACLRRMGL